MYFTMGAPFSLKITSSDGESGPHLRHDTLGLSEPKAQTASRSIQPFCTDDRRVSYTLQWAAPSPSKLLLNPNGISIG